MPKTVPCPICGRPNDFFAEPLGPFCTVRCKQVDLGKWFGEDYCISEPVDPDALEEGQTGEEG